jgi:hypothetical protein
MNPVLIHDQQIGLVFKSGNVVHVDYWAIEELDFDTNGSVWVFDKSHKQMLTSPKLTRLHLKLNVSNERLFWTSNRLRDTDSTIEDGRECVKQIIERRDLSFITLNGIDYLIPLKEKTIKINGFERTVNELEKVVFKHDRQIKRDFVTIDVEIPNEN